MRSLRLALLLATVASGAPLLAAEQVLYRNSFDSGSFWNGLDGWSVRDANPNSGLVSWDDDFDAGARAYSGRALHCADLVGSRSSGTDQYYANSMEAIAERAFDLSSFRTGDRVTLRLRLWYSTEARYDYFRIKVSTDGGPYATVFQVHGEGRFWQLVSVDLSAHAGRRSVRVALVFQSDWSVVREGAYVDDFTVVAERRGEARLQIANLWVSGTEGGTARLVFQGAAPAYPSFLLRNSGTAAGSFFVLYRLRRWEGASAVRDITAWTRAPASGFLSLDAGQQRVYSIRESTFGAGAYSLDLAVYDANGSLRDQSCATRASIDGHRYGGRYYRGYGVADPHPTSDWLADDRWHNPSNEDVLLTAATRIAYESRNNPAAGQGDLSAFVVGAIFYQSGNTRICVQHPNGCDPGDDTSDVDNLRGTHRKADGTILGDCNDYADLYIGLARSMGLPSRTLWIEFFSGRGRSNIVGYGENWNMNEAHLAAETLVCGSWTVIDPTWRFIGDNLRWLNSRYARNGHVATVFARSKRALYSQSQYRYDESRRVLDFLPNTTYWGDAVLRYNPEPPPGITCTRRDDPDAFAKPGSEGYYFNVPVRN
ncbi:MAG: hypothetical protein HY720_00755 [Planctomycetes bacterium]|nr:hypothetical protein [Planctomycetota bacterium]